MKKLLVIVFILSFSLPSSAQKIQKQDDTLIGEVNSVGFYFSPVLKYGRVDDIDIDAFRNDTTNIYYIGGQLGFVLNHKLVIGLSGYGLLTDASDYGLSSLDTSNYKLYYGGLFLKYILMPHSMLHFSVHSLFGAGRFHYEDTEELYYAYNFRGPRGRFSNYYNDYNIEKDSFYVFEPGVDVMLNLHKNIRIGVGMSYRYVKGLESEFLNDKDLVGITTQALIKIGTF